MHGETINRHESYTKSEFLRRIGRREASWRALRHAGLRTINAAGGAFVLGADWLDFLSNATPQNRRKAMPAAESSPETATA